MGKGKGNLEYWVAVVKPGRVMFEISGVSEEIAKEALVLQYTNYQLSVRLFLVKLQKAVTTVKTRDFVKELNNKSVDELNNELVAAKKELFNLRFQNATNQLENTSRIKEVRRNIARIQGAITAKANAQ